MAEEEQQAALRFATLLAVHERQHLPVWWKRARDRKREKAEQQRQRRFRRVWTAMAAEQAPPPLVVARLDYGKKEQGKEGRHEGGCRQQWGSARLRWATEVADSPCSVLPGAKEPLLLHFLNAPRPLPLLLSLVQPQALRVAFRRRRAGELQIPLTSRGQAPGQVGLRVAVAELAVPATPRPLQEPRSVGMGTVVPADWALAAGLRHAVSADYHRCLRRALLMFPSRFPRCFCCCSVNVHRSMVQYCCHCCWCWRCC